jgi:adenylate cyclase
LKKYDNPDDIWRDWFSTSAQGVEKRMRQVFARLPREPRCKFCNAPFEGVGASVMRVVFNKERSALNPRFCNMCEVAAREFPGGAEVEMSMLFADMRGSTALSETMSPSEFGKLINRFYTGATRLIVDEDGLVEKLAGDAVAAFWGAGFAGPSYVRRTVEVARNLCRYMADQDIPVGIGVHAGVAYFGVVGTDNMANITALGDEVNTAARLGSHAAAGEVLVSEQALQKAGVEFDDMEVRRLELKGIGQPVLVRVMNNS